MVELAKHLAQHPMVHRVDLLTRLIQAPQVAEEYGEAEECILKTDGEYGGAYIVRLAAGDPKVYIPKEELWPHVRECVHPQKSSNRLGFVEIVLAVLCVVASFILLRVGS